MLLGLIFDTRSTTKIELTYSKILKVIFIIDIIFIFELSSSMSILIFYQTKKWILHEGEIRRKNIHDSIWNGMLLFLRKSIFI
jgi:hypothetical protein